MHYVEAKSLLTKWNSMNIYRGCSHGCIYCDSRSKCYRIDHAFEDIEVKRNAPELLESILRSKRKKCMISTGSMSDPYMPLEEELCLTRRCLEVIERYGFGASVITKSNRVLRDLDLFIRINEQSKAVVQMTLTTCDDALCRILEPHVSVSSERIEALRTLHAHGIPTVVWMSPILPFIEDTRGNIERLVDECIGAGARGIICFGMGMTLREGNREYYYTALDKRFPGMREQYEKNYGLSYSILSPRNEELMELFHTRCAEYGVIHDTGQCFAYLHELPQKYGQLSLF